MERHYYFRLRGTQNQVKATVSIKEGSLVKVRYEYLEPSQRNQVPFLTSAELDEVSDWMDKSVYPLLKQPSKHLG